MKFRSLLLVCAGASTFLAAAAPQLPLVSKLPAQIALKQQKVVFDAATSPLDAGGDAYSFQNVSQVTRYAKYLPVALRKGVLASGGTKEDAFFAEEIARIIVRIVNPAVLKAVAASSAGLEPDIFRARSYSYLGKKGMSQPSLFDLTGKVNHPLSWQTLPADTRFALDTDFYPGVLYTRTLAALKKSSDPRLSSLPEELEQLKAQGVDLETYLTGVTHFSLIIVGSSLQNVGVTFSIADASGKIAEQLKILFPPAENANIVPLPLPLPGCSPALCYGDKTITFTTHQELLTRKFPAKLGDLSQMRKFAAYLPTEGTGYLYCNLDKESVAVLKNLLEETEQGKLGAKLLAPFSFLAISSVTEEGYLATAVSDFSFAQAATKLSIAMPLISTISAFTKARQTAEKNAVQNHMKQLGVSLFLYAQDHDNTLPKTLKELEKEEYLPKGVSLVSPKTKKEYLYVGAGLNLAKIGNASVRPVLLEAPGAPEGASALYADGHWEFIPMAGYQDPAQLVGELNKRHHYPPEELDALLKAVSVK